MKMLVTGGTGMVGLSLKAKFPQAVFVGSKDFDLTDRDQTDAMLDKHKPDTVIHCAARVGGILDNDKNPFHYFADNARINLNVVDECFRHRIPRLIAISSTCVYPAKVEQYPMTLPVLHSGPPDPTNFGYAYAKRMMQVHIEAARQQFGCDWTVVYPSNLYGPNDTFDLERSHVIPAMLLKVHQAKKAKDAMVKLRGSGFPQRQFTYVDDLSTFIKRVVDKNLSGDFNFAYPSNHTIASAAALVKDVVKYEGRFEWDGTMNGVMRKDVEAAATTIMRHEEYTNLRDGLANTYRWFVAQESKK